MAGPPSVVDGASGVVGLVDGWVVGVLRVLGIVNCWVMVEVGGTVDVGDSVGLFIPYIVYNRIFYGM